MDRLAQDALDIARNAAATQDERQSAVVFALVSLGRSVDRLTEEVRRARR